MRKYVKITRQCKSSPCCNVWPDFLCSYYLRMHREAKDLSLFMCNYFSVVLSPTCTLLLNFYSRANLGRFVFAVKVHYSYLLQVTNQPHQGLHRELLEYT